MVRLLTEQSDTKSNVKLPGFRSQLRASYVSNHNEELWYNETVCLIIYIYMDDLKSILHLQIFIGNYWILKISVGRMWHKVIFMNLW